MFSWIRLCTYSSCIKAWLRIWLHCACSYVFIFKMLNTLCKVKNQLDITTKRSSLCLMRTFYCALFISTTYDLIFNLSTCAKPTLNKTESTLNKTYIGLKSMYQGIQIYFAWNPSCKGMEGPCWAAQPIQPELVWIGPNGLCYPAWPFHALAARISNKIYLETLKHAH